MEFVGRDKNMFLETSDGLKISYDYYPSVGPARGYLALVHMMPATKESWKEFAAFLQKEGYSSIAIDLRGHGRSDGGPRDYQSFSDEDHQKSILDLNAAVEFLKDQGATPEKIIFVGASIGANLSLQYLAENPEVKSAILLSPGLDYRGILTEPLARKLSTSQSVLLVASEDDILAGGNAVLVSRRLYGLIPQTVNKKLLIYKKGGHGTDLFASKETDLNRDILDFLK